MKKINLYFCLLIALGCSAEHKLILQKKYYQRKVLYVLNIPKPDHIAEKTDDDRNEEHLAYFSNGAVIYITDNLNTGGAFLDYKIAKYGASYPSIYYGLRDTATLFGLDKGRFWKEFKYKKIIVGYYNVAADQKIKFDNILKEVIPQVDSEQNRRH